MRPVFVIGSPRSGTTLLNSLLLASGHFVIYEAEPLLLTVCQQKYGGLSIPSHRARFLHDWLQSRQHYRSGLSEEDFRGLVDESTDYFELLDKFMATMASRQTRQGWSDSTPGNWRHVGKIIQRFPDARIIHVIRDGRSVAASRRALGWTVFPSSNPMLSLLLAASSWIQIVERVRSAGAANPKRFLELRFEQIVTEPEAVARSLSEFLDMTIHATDFSTATVGSLNQPNSAFRGTNRRDGREALDRWRRVLSTKEQSTLTAFLGDALTNLGYLDDGNVAPEKWMRPLRFALISAMSAKSAVASLPGLRTLGGSTLEIGLR